MMRKTMWMLTLIAFLSPAACGNDDDEGSTTSDPTQALEEAQAKAGCSSLPAQPTTPVDACNTGYCAMIQANLAQKSSAYWSKLGDCVSQFITCYGDLCASLSGGAETYDAAKGQKCGSDYLSCVCTISEVKEALGATCNTATGS